MASRNGRIPLGSGRKGSAVVGTVAWADGRTGRHPFAPGPPGGGGLPGPLDLSQTLYVLIVQQWVQTLEGPYDWGGWPLSHYVFSDAFLRKLEHLADLDNVAWVCAMVACGLAHEFVELEVQPRTAVSGAGELVREDGAGGYRCIILTGQGAGSRLDYWRLPSGVIEFDEFSALRLIRTEPKPE